MKNLIFLSVLAAFITGYFYERQKAITLSGQVQRLEVKCSELEALDTIRTDTIRPDNMPKRWGQDYLNERIHR